MPTVEVGDVVWWYDKGNTVGGPTAAIVTAVGTEVIGLFILVPGYHNGMVMDGVRHTSDPMRKTPQGIESGLWQHRGNSPQREIDKLRSELNSVLARIMGNKK